MADYLTVQQAADRLGMTPQSVRRAIEQGRLAARRFGHMYQIDVREVERYRTKPKGTGGRPRTRPTDGTGG